MKARRITLNILRLSVVQTVIVTSHFTGKPRALHSSIASQDGDGPPEFGKDAEGYGTISKWSMSVSDRSRCPSPPCIGVSGEEVGEREEPAASEWDTGVCVRGLV